ncbi:hypothetical protein J8I87_35055 [Paraburkholderia sp. LEh10]|uniref:hypothetical protein n=1 Tax=Paraburkholderia sp. LEh10 TaxID=2821353 RepID=UPI001AE98EF4|nr:hypothetical protein [Paraburkholderia sp. LEh10]MBP0594793.1 hypothetical protein [Paraburkholderia sp. LEh10]
MPADESNDGFSTLSTLSDTNVVKLVTKLIDGFEHSNPQFTYKEVLADAANSKAAAKSAQQ